MAPKASPAKGKEGKGKKEAKDDAPDSAPMSTGNAAAPQSKDEVLAQVNLEGLPHCPNEQIVDILKDKYENLVTVFIHYCKQSDCKNLEQATRLRLGASIYSGPPITPPRLPRRPRALPRLPSRRVCLQRPSRVRSRLQEAHQGRQPRAESV